jgi:6-phosphogluconolactonase
MPTYMYISLQDDDQIRVFAMDAATGHLTPKGGLPVAGGPSHLTLSLDRKVLYAGHRTGTAISSFRIDPGSGGLTPIGTVKLEAAPTYMATDRTGRFLLSAYYQGAHVEVHPLGEDGAVGAPACDRLDTAQGAHAVQTDLSNRYAFVPHIARFNDNVLEPLRESTGPNAIWQLRFDAQTGRLSPNTPLKVEPATRLGPRHYCFHPTLPVAYFSNEQGSSVTAYRLDPATGTLTAAQTLTTLPEGFTARNTCSQIHLTPSGRFLYVGNRGHNSLAGFAVDAATGLLTAHGQVGTEAVPGAFGLDPEGQFAAAAGTATGRLAVYRIQGETGALTPLETYAVGQRPMAVLITQVGD